jgi:hypothetical protein
MLLTLIPILYGYFISSSLWLKLTPMLPLLQLFFWLNSLIFLFLTQTTDPGLIPPKSTLDKLNLDTPYTFIYQ